MVHISDIANHIEEQPDPISGEELEFAFRVADAAMNLQMPTTNPETYTVEVESGGETEIYRFQDDAHQRSMFAVMEHYKGDRKKILSVMGRINALIELLYDPQMWPWLGEVDENGKLTEISDAAFEVAGKIPVMEDHEFDKQLFIEQIKKLNAKKG